MLWLGLVEKHRGPIPCSADLTRLELQGHNPRIEITCSSPLLLQVKGKQFPVDVFSAFPARPGLNGAEGPRPEVRDEEGRRLGRGEREALSAAENSTGDDGSPTAAAPRRVGMLVTKRPMIGRDKALAQVRVQCIACGVCKLPCLQIHPSTCLLSGQTPHDLTAEHAHDMHAMSNVERLHVRRSACKVLPITQVSKLSTRSLKARCS